MTGPARVVLRIDRVVVDGVPAARHGWFLEVLRAELAALLAAEVDLGAGRRERHLTGSAALDDPRAVARAVVTALMPDGGRRG